MEDRDDTATLFDKERNIWLVWEGLILDRCRLSIIREVI